MIKASSGLLFTNIVLIVHKTFSELLNNTKTTYIYLGGKLSCI